MKRMIALLLVIGICLTVLPIAVTAGNTPITLYGFATCSDDLSIEGQWIKFSDTNSASVTKLGNLPEKLGSDCYAAAYARGMVYGYTANDDAPDTTSTFWYAPADDITNVKTIKTTFAGQMEDMAYDYTHNYMYGIAWVGEGSMSTTKYSDYALVSCDLSTGAVTYIGRLCYPGDSYGQYFHVSTLAIDAQGHAYILGSDDYLYALDLNTVKITRIGQIGYSFDYVQSMCWDYDNDRLLWARESKEGDWGLYEVSTETGSAKYLGRIATKDTEIVGLFMIPSKEPYIFTDVKEDDWFFEGVNYCYDSALMNGMSLSTFEPMTNTSRAMVVTILYRLEKTPSFTADNPFKDVSTGQWYTNAVIWAAENGIVNGTAPDRFEPNSNITREQLAAIMYRYAEYKGYPMKEGTLDGFNDVNQIDEYAMQAMTWAVGEGIINGTEDETGKYLDPQGNANRAMIATILMRFVSGYSKG